MSFDLNRPRPDKEACKWAMLCHLGGIASLTLVPFGAVVVPLVIWLLRREDHPYIEQQGREAINFQFNMSLLLLAAWIISGILGWVLPDGFVWLLVMFPAHFIQLGGTAVGAIRAYDGEDFSYPCIFHLVQKRGSRAGTEAEPHETP